jgi:hypothetical protein
LVQPESVTSGDAELDEEIAVEGAIGMLVREWTVV